MDEKLELEKLSDKKLDKVSGGALSKTEKELLEGISKSMRKTKCTVCGCEYVPPDRMAIPPSGTFCPQCNKKWEETFGKLGRIKLDEKS